ncbi:hypothetical protein AGMMS4957_09540 [Bacteroidia bacterium]|nr:hypothetical protein AGMMS4957_09540 [Bacteroidia bacterium]
MSCKYRPHDEKQRDREPVERTAINSETQIDHRSKENTIRMEKENGVYYLPIEVNDVPMRFIFDTGASVISISLTEAYFLYKQGKLTDEDILGTAQYQDANGVISEGQIIRLRKVCIGNRVIHNVEASVVNNQVAPLLLGQSVLGKFGKISIDYKRLEISFE